MNDILEKLAAQARERSAKQKTFEPLSSIRQRLRRAGPARRFRAALEDGSGPRIIAELKRASPSKGVIRADFRPVELSRALEKAGVTALSILTEEEHFHGSEMHLKQVREVVSLPLLRKDFVMDEYEVYRSRLLGADAVLLIVALLSEEQLRSLVLAGHEAGIDTLVEVHDEAEAEIAVGCGARLIGVNNRDLRTFEVNLNTARRLAERLPAHVTKVCESGISTKADLQMMVGCGYRAFLIGEALMRSERPDQKLREILS